MIYVLYRINNFKRVNVWEQNFRFRYFHFRILAISGIHDLEQDVAVVGHDAQGFVGVTAEVGK